MIISYNVSYSGTLDFDDDEWEAAKKNYRGNIENFAMTAVSEELGLSDTDSINITSIRVDV